MGNIHNLATIRQCLSYISEKNIRLPITDHRVQKLTAESCLKLILASQLARWDSYRHIVQELRTSEVLQESIELSSISASQVSRRLRALPPDLFESLFLALIAQVKSHTQIACSKIGPLRIIDATCLKMPATLAGWAYVSRKASQVKIHVRVLALPKGEVIPERAIPTTGNVSDYEVMGLLAENDGTIYVMDRGYVKYKQFDAWVENQVRFVTRLHDRHGVWRVEEERAVPPNTDIVRDAIVQLGTSSTRTEQTVRLVEFFDDHGRLYRIATSCLELEATEIAEIYRHRWLIELYFKWMKQHLRLVKLYSYEPEGVWNQIFIALIAYAIAMLIQLESGTKASLWDVLQAIRSCWYKPWSVCESELHPKPSRTSRGRQKHGTPREKPGRVPSDVGIIKPSKAKAEAEARAKEEHE